MFKGYWLLIIVIGILLSGCGSSSSNSDLSSTLRGLTQIPSSSSMVSSGSSSSVSQSIRGFSIGSIDNFAVSGTPPKLSSLSSSNVDTYFWNGLIATIIAQGNATEAQRNRFWGQVEGGPGGHGACYMAQGVGEAMGRILQSATSACYMKGITEVNSGVTVTGSTQSEIFDQKASDKIVKVLVSGMGEEANMDVFIKVFGTNTVGANVYSVTLWFCRSGSVNGNESITVDKSTGVLTTTHFDDSSEGKYTDSVVAYLKASNGSIVFDTEKARTASSLWRKTGGSEIYRGDVTITGSSIYAKRYFSSSWGVDKNYSISHFSGNKFSNLRFTEAAFKGSSTKTSSSTYNYSGGTEFNGTYYAATSTSSLVNEVNSFSFSSDTFYTSIPNPSIDKTNQSCTATPDVTVTMDFTNSAVAALNTTCESDRFDNYSMCWGSNVQSAMNIVNQ